MQNCNEFSNWRSQDSIKSGNSSLNRKRSCYLVLHFMSYFSRWSSMAYVSGHKLGHLQVPDREHTVWSQPGIGHGVVRTEGNRGPRVSFTGAVAPQLQPGVLPYLADHSVLSDFPIFQEKLTLLWNLPTWEMCTKWVAFCHAVFEIAGTPSAVRNLNVQFQENNFGGKCGCRSLKHKECRWGNPWKKKKELRGPGIPAFKELTEQSASKSWSGTKGRKE